MGAKFIISKKGKLIVKGFSFLQKNGFNETTLFLLEDGSSLGLSEIDIFASRKLTIILVTNFNCNILLVNCSCVNNTSINEEEVIGISSLSRINTYIGDYGSIIIDGLIIKNIGSLVFFTYINTYAYTNFNTSFKRISIGNSSRINFLEDINFPFLVLEQW